ncbi:MAG: hypothetical protein ACR2OI_10860 [Acidimicrobiia bacterium]
MSAKFSLVVAGAVLAAACTSTAVPSSGPPSTNAPLGTTTSTTTDSLSRPPFCSELWEPQQTGNVDSDELDEISGAAVSRDHADVIWVHNDSGNDAEVFAIDATGTELGRVSLPDLSARDWEDMALGPGPDPDRDYLYLADIGDNRGTRDEVSIHRIPEPDPDIDAAPGGETLLVTYPAGPTEAETLLVDPVSGDMLIVGKAISGQTPVHEIPGTVDWSLPHEASYLGEIGLGTFAVATGGDVGVNVILIRTYDEVFMWERRPGEGLAAGLSSPRCRVASVNETQGEAIALTPDETSFYTISEGEHQPILSFSGQGTGS